MRVLTYLRVVSMIKIHSIKTKVVEDLGAGPVERNIVRNTTIPKRDKSFLPQKTIMMPHAVEMNKDLFRMNTVQEDTQDIVLIVGNYIVSIGNNTVLGSIFACTSFR